MFPFHLIFAIFSSRKSHHEEKGRGSNWIKVICVLLNQKSPHDLFSFSKVVCDHVSIRRHTFRALTFFPDFVCVSSRGGAIFAMPFKWKHPNISEQFPHHFYPHPIFSPAHIFVPCTLPIVSIDNVPAGTASLLPAGGRRGPPCLPEPPRGAVAAARCPAGAVRRPTAGPRLRRCRRRRRSASGRHCGVGGGAARDAGGGAAAGGGPPPAAGGARRGDPDAGEGVLWAEPLVFWFRWVGAISRSPDSSIPPLQLPIPKAITKPCGITGLILGHFRRILSNVSHEPHFLSQLTQAAKPLFFWA